jgi:hypothetical protein
LATLWARIEREYGRRRLQSDRDRIKDELTQRAGEQLLDTFERLRDYMELLNTPDRVTRQDLCGWFLEGIYDPGLRERDHQPQGAHHVLRDGAAGASGMRRLLGSHTGLVGEALPRLRRFTPPQDPARQR